MKETFLFKMLYYIIFVYGVLVLTPYTMIYCKMILAIVAVIWLVLIGLYMWKKNIKEMLVVSAVGFFFLWEIILKLLGHSSALWAIYGTHFLFIITVFMSVYVKCWLTDKEKGNLSSALFVAVMVNLLHNIWLYNKYENLNNFMYTELFELTFGKINAGGTGFGNVIICFGFISLIYFFQTEHLIKKGVMLLLYILSALFVSVLLGRGTATILLLLGSMLFLWGFLCKRFDNSSVHIMYASLISLGLLVAIFAVPFLNLLIPFINVSVSERLGLKLMNIRDFMAGTSNVLSPRSGDSLAGRINMMISDIKYFYSTPLTLVLGNGLHTYSAKTVYLTTAINKSSGHSDVFDMLARYGTIGIIYMIVYFNYVRTLGTKIKGYKNIWMIFWFIYLGTGILSGCFGADISMMMLIVAPGMLHEIFGEVREI